MTLFEDVKRLQEKCRDLESDLDETRKQVNRLDQTINDPERGISAAINAQTGEIASLRKAAYWVAGVIVVGAITFAFAAMSLTAGGPV